MRKKIRTKKIKIQNIILAISLLLSCLISLHGNYSNAFADEPQWVTDLINTYGVPEFTFRAGAADGTTIEPTDADFYSIKHDGDNVYNVNLGASSNYDFGSVGAALGCAFTYEVDGAVRSKVMQDLYTTQYGFYSGSLDVHKLMTDYENNKSIGTVKFVAYATKDNQKAAIYSHEINFEVDTIYPHLTLKTISQYGVDITPVWDEYIFRGADGSGDYGDYYYPVANNADKVTVGVQIDGLPENETYRVFDQEITANDNGTIIYKEMNPSVSMRDVCWRRPDGSCYGFYNYANEYHVEAYLQKVNGNSDDSVMAILRPQTVGSSDIEILSVQQDGVDVYLDTIGRQVKDQTALQTINEYQLLNYDRPVTVRYKLKNLHEGWTYYSYAYNGSGSSNESFVANSSEKTFTQEIYLNGTKKHDSTYVVVSGNNFADGLNDYVSSSVPLYFRMADANFVPVESLIVDGVWQDNKKIDPTYNENTHRYTFEVNDVQDITLKFHADSVMTGATYLIESLYYSNYAMSSQGKPVLASFSGDDLKNGATMTFKARYGESEKSPFHLYLYIKANEGATSKENPKLYYIDDVQSNENYYDNYYEFDFNFFESGSVPRYEVGLAYASYPNIKISDSGAINPKYHDAENPLSVKVDGRHYDEDTGYDINLNVTYGQNETVYTKTITKTGRELNDGVEILLNGFEMALPDIATENFAKIINAYSEYNFNIKINELSQDIDADYAYDGDLSSVVIFDNGQVNATGMGSGGLDGPYASMEAIGISYAPFNNGRTATINYVGSGYDDNITYQYELYRTEGKGHGGADWNVLSSKKIGFGTITGKELNNGRLSFNVVPPSLGNDSVAYDLLIEKDNKLVRLAEDYLNFWNGVGLSSFSLTTDRNLYLQMNKISYTVPKYNDVNTKLTGNGFENDEEYTLKVDYTVYKSAIDEYGYYTANRTDVSDLNEEISCNGSELNNGMVYKIKYDDRMGKADNVYINFTVSDDDNNVYPGHLVFLNYVDVKNILTSDKGYQIDNKTGRIKKISHDTSLDKIKDELKVSDGGTMKMFKSDGETEQSGNVGTGMIMRIMDEYDRPILDMEAVVTGDATGTGTINSADLLTIRRHLIGTSELDGAYYEAANVVEDDVVNSADLLRMRQHLIGVNTIE